MEYSLNINILHALKLRHVLGVIKTNGGTYHGDKYLMTIRIYGLKNNINLYDSYRLSTKSVLYMIQNEAATSAITVTLHADVYAKAMANADIVAALEAHPNVSLASA